MASSSTSHSDEAHRLSAGHYTNVLDLRSDEGATSARSPGTGSDATRTPDQVRGVIGEVQQPRPGLSFRNEVFSFIKDGLR